jgi:hypothetical protein
MPNFVRLMSWLTFPFTLAIVGCSSEPAAPPAAEVSAEDTEAAITARLDLLSPEDRALAVAQGTCPVSGARIGSMDGIQVVEVKGRRVVLCCEACREPMLSEPDKYLAKLAPAAGTPAETSAGGK